MGQRYRLEHRQEAEDMELRGQGWLIPTSWLTAIERRHREREAASTRASHDELPKLPEAIRDAAMRRLLWRP